MRIIASIIATVATIAGFSLMVAPAAQATTCVPLTNVCNGGDISHHSPDGGYDAPIRVRCDFGKGPTRYVHEGTSSKSDCGVDTDQVYVGAGQQINCRYQEPRGIVRWKNTFDATGWHKIGDFWSKSCVMARD